MRKFVFILYSFVSFPPSKYPFIMRSAPFILFKRLPFPPFKSKIVLVWVCPGQPNIFRQKKWEDKFSSDSSYMMLASILLNTIYATSYRILHNVILYYQEEFTSNGFVQCTWCSIYICHFLIFRRNSQVTLCTWCWRPPSSTSFSLSSPLFSSTPGSLHPHVSILNLHYVSSSSSLSSFLFLITILILILFLISTLMLGRIGLALQRNKMQRCAVACSRGGQCHAERWSKKSFTIALNVSSLTDYA